MKRFAVVIAAVTAFAFSATASAQQVEYKVTVSAEAVKGTPNDHFLTFTGPVQVPDVTLPAGTYVFSVLSPSIVQVMSADRSQRYAMFFTAPVERRDQGDDYVMTISRAAAGAPGRITKWFVPHREKGFEFLYPHASGDR